MHDGLHLWDLLGHTVITAGGMSLGCSCGWVPSVRWLPETQRKRLGDHLTGVVDEGRRLLCVGGPA